MMEIESKLLDIKNKQYLYNKKIKINKSLSFIVTCFYINSLILALLSSTLSILFLKSSIIKYFTLILTIFIFNKYYSFKNKQLDEEGKKILIPDLKTIDEELEKHTYILENEDKLEQELSFENIINNSDLRTLQSYRKLLLLIKETKTSKNYNLCGDESKNLILKFIR